MHYKLGMIEFSDMEKFSIGELRRIDIKWYDAKEIEISMSLERDRSFMQRTLGKRLKNAEEEYRRQVS